MTGLVVTVVNVLALMILAPGLESKVEVERSTVVRDREKPADLSANVSDPPSIALELSAKGTGVIELEVKSMVDANDTGISDDARLAEATETAEEIGVAALDMAGPDPVEQLKLYNGVVLNVVPTRPKLGLGEVG